MMRIINSEDYLNGHMIVVRMRDGEIIPSGDPRESQKGTRSVILVDEDFVAKLLHPDTFRVESVSELYSLMEELGPMPSRIAVDENNTVYWLLEDILEWGCYLCDWMFDLNDDLFNLRVAFLAVAKVLEDFEYETVYELEGSLPTNSTEITEVAA